MFKGSSGFPRGPLESEPLVYESIREQHSGVGVNMGSWWSWWSHLGQLRDLDQPLEVLKVTGAIEQTLQPETQTEVRGQERQMEVRRSEVKPAGELVLLKLLLEAVSVALEGVGWEA